MDETPRTITAATLGEAWLAVAAHILDEGPPGSYDGLPATWQELRALLEQG